MIDGIVQFQNNVLDLFQSLKRSTSSIDHDTSSTCYTYMIYGCHNYQNTTTYDVRNNKSNILFFIFAMQWHVRYSFQDQILLFCIIFSSNMWLKTAMFWLQRTLRIPISTYVSKFDKLDMLWTNCYYNK